MRVEVVLSAAGVAPIRATGELRVLSPAARAGRAAGIMLISLALAAAIVPVPIIHLVGIPLILMTGLLTAIRQLRSVARLAPLQIACPRCGARNSLGGGLGLRTTTGSLELTCESCRRVLLLTLEAVETSERTSA